MLASQDSICFGYDEFYSDYLGVPYNRGLMDLSKAILVHPSIFSAKDPRHVCLAALHGHAIYPFDEASIKERVKKEGSYSKTISARMRHFSEIISEFNERQQREGWMSGAVIMIDENVPYTLEAFESIGLGGTDVAKAALELEIDRKFFSLGHSGRLNHFSRHLGFPNIEVLEAFVRQLDEEAIKWGFPSYAAICVSTRCIDHFSNACKARPGDHSALDELLAKKDLLKSKSAFVIERFIACRLGDERKSFYVDVNAEGTFVALYEGPLKGAGIVSSQYLSDRSPEFHRKWFE